MKTILTMMMAICFTINGGAYTIHTDKIDNCKYVLVDGNAYVYSVAYEGYVGYKEASDKPVIKTNYADYEAYMCFSTDKHDKTLGCKYQLKKKKHTYKISNECKAKIRAKYKKIK